MENTAVPNMQPTIQITVDGIVYDRIPIKTRLIDFREDMDSVIKENVVPFFQKGDFVAISEKVLSLSQNKVRHIDTVKVSPLAKFIVKGVKKHKTMTAWSRPEKIQVAIEEAGVWRIIPAMVLGAMGKMVGIRGIFWAVAGHRVAEIDGFIPESMYPYTEWAILPAERPQEFCDEMEKRLGIPVVIADANDIDVKILGVSKGIGLSFGKVRKILLDNPLGQGKIMTPFVLVRKEK